MNIAEAEDLTGEYSVPDRAYACIVKMLRTQQSSVPSQKRSKAVSMRHPRRISKSHLSYCLEKYFPHNLPGPISVTIFGLLEPATCRRWGASLWLHNRSIGQYTIPYLLRKPSINSHISMITEGHRSPRLTPYVFPSPSLLSLCVLCRGASAGFRTGKTTG